uniref:porin family protein n=1 Tax=Segatella hominis TaxID=2518605 RepID=UPI004025E0EF
MKKVLTFMLLASLLFVQQANAQVKFGLKGGLNVTNMSFSKDVFDASNKTGFFVGPMVKITLPVVGLSFDAAALYDQKEADVKYQGTDNSYFKENVKQKSLNIPVNVRYGWGLSSVANIFLFAGPQWGINVGDKNFKWDTGSSYSLKKSNFSVNVGAGVTLLSHVQLSANYNIACGKTADASLEKVGETVLGSDRSRNNSWQIALGYWF